MASRITVFAVAALAALATLPPSPPARAAAKAPDGATLYRQRCQACHGVAGAQPSPLGPSLVGIVDRKAGSTTFNYSPALKQSAITWTRANLDRYLSGPTRMVPGTRMVISVTDPAQRTALINHLATRR